MTRKPQTGRGLRAPAALRDEFSAEWLALIERMTREVNRDIVALFHSPAAGSMPGTAMDADEDINLYERIQREIREEEARARAQARAEKGKAADPRPISETTGSIASQSRILLNRMTDKYTLLFGAAAALIVGRMIQRLARHSARGLKQTAKTTSGFTIPLSAFESPELREILKASVEQSAGLIKRIPAEYLGKVQNAVMRSIQTGAGSNALFDELETYRVKTKNWAYNTARDQTTRVYASIARQNMLDAGVKRFEWVHSGGGSHPREHHLERWPEGLNRGIFAFDDPPVIDPKTGETGFPAQLPNCRCFARPLFDFSE